MSQQTNQGNEQGNEQGIINPQKFYKRDEIAEILNVHWMTLKRAGEAGHLRYCKIGRHYRFLGQDVIDWMAAKGRTGAQFTPDSKAFGKSTTYKKLSPATRKRRETEWARELKEAA